MCYASCVFFTYEVNPIYVSYSSWSSSYCSHEVDHNPREPCFANKINIFHGADAMWLQVIVDAGMFVGRKTDSRMSGLATLGFCTRGEG